MAKLPKAPLQEVILEIRWIFDTDSQSTQAVDIDYPMAVGKMQSLVEEEFPIYKRKYSIDIPEQPVLHYQTVHQFWSGDGKWPVLQLGPGIFTVNDTEKNYDWEAEFFPMAIKNIHRLWKAYGGTLKVNFASLRYIDSVLLAEYGEQTENWKEFIQNNLNFSFTNYFDARGKLKVFQVNQFFELQDKSALHINISSGKKNKEPALLWQTAVIKKQSFTPESLIDWLKEAHRITSDLFKEITKPDFYGSFNN